MLLQGTRLAPRHPRRTIWGVPIVPVAWTSCKQTKSVRRPHSQRIPGDFTCRFLPQPLATLMEQHADHHAQETPASWASLLITCGLMFVGAYSCGMLPRWLPNQQRLSSSVNAVGAGLLLGSALCIILPEGFQAAVEDDAPSWAVSATLLSGFWLMMLLDSLTHWLPGGDQHTHRSSSSSSSSNRGTAMHRGTGVAAGSSSSVLELSEQADARVLPAGGKTPMARPGRLIIGSREAGGGEEHTVLLTDFAMEQDAAAAAGDESSGAAHVQYTPSWRPGSSPTKSRAAARSATLPNTPVTSAGGTAAAAAGGGGGGGGAVSGGGGGTPGGGSVRRLASASGGGSLTASAGSATAWGGAAGAAGGSSSSSSTAAAAAGGTDAAVAGSSGREHVLLRSGSGLPLSSSGKGGGGGLGSGQEWWRPWLIDPTHHALLGLLVHSVSDGLAVGAASLSSVPEVSLGVATAMVVHKGPVALGLATFLRGAAWTPAQVHRGVLLFAAASPLAALLTYGLLSAVPGITSNIPLVVLFSGGTVLYAATMHILPGAMRSRSSTSSKGGQHNHQHAGSMDRSQLLLVSLGMLAPLVLSTVFAGHHHHHHVH